MGQYGTAKMIHRHLVFISEKYNSKTRKNQGVIRVINLQLK